MPPSIQELIEHMSPEERLRLIGEIWDSLPAEQVELSESHREELDRRLADADANPGAGVPWEEVRARLWAKR
jgi:putative addiction module component (TIGR02574 family)